jgi:hypothetical protein
MAAGLGFKTFATGDVLSAADVNGYLMQGVLVFASAAARNAAITSPQEGQFAFTKDTNGLWYYDGAAWVASGAAGDIEGVTAGVGISGGGTSGTVTITNSMATAIDAKGDLVAGTAADTFSRLAIGTNNQVLTADSTAATGMKWATVSGGGLTSLSSGSFTGTTFLISSIPSGYKDLLLVINRNAPNTDGDTLRLRINENTASNYAYFSTMTSTNTSFGSTFFEIAPAQDNSANAGTTIVYLPEYLTATGAWRQMISNSIANNPTTNTNFNWATYNGVYKVSSAVTSLTIYNSSSDFADGNYVLYGVK